MAFQQVYIGQQQPQNNVNGMTLEELLAQVNQLEQQKPVETRIAPEIWARDIQNGLNNENKLVSEWQTANNIRKPQTMEEIEQARAGEFNKPEVISTGTAKPSLYNNISNGFTENYNNSLFQNLQNGEQGTGWGYKLGQGLGTVGRFVDSPLGRGLIAGGLMAMAGGSPTLALGTGLTAGVGRQNFATADKLYRNQLKQYGYTDEDLSKIRGNITGDMYKNLSQNLYKTQKLSQDNYTKLKALYDRQLQTGSLSPEEYKLRLTALNNLYVNSNIATVEAGNVKDSNQTRMTDIQEQLLPYKQYALETAPQVALGNLGVNQGNLGLRNAEFKYRVAKDEYDRNHPTIDAKTKLSLSDKSDALQQIQDLRALVNSNTDATGFIVGNLAKGNTLGQKIVNKNSSNGAIQTRAGIAKLRGTTMHDLAGTAQTLQEQQNLAPFLPDATDDVRTINAKLDQLEAEIKREYSSILDSYGYAKQQTPQKRVQGQVVNNGKTQQIGKYKVRVK